MASHVKRTEAHKANIMDVVNQLSEQELEQVSDMLGANSMKEEEE